MPIALSCAFDRGLRRAVLTEDPSAGWRDLPRAKAEPFNTRLEKKFDLDRTALGVYFLAT